MRKLALLLAVALVTALTLSTEALARPVARASIIGGLPANPGSWPWTAFIVSMQADGDGEACSGTIVAPRVVLTAAHCVTDPNAGDYRVITGNVDWTQESARQVSPVTQTVTFPYWERDSHYGDAGLLVLSTPTTAPAIAPATLDDVALLRAGRSAVVAGWGLTSASDKNPSNILRVGAVQLQKPSYCGRRAAELHDAFQPAGMLCTIDSRDFLTGPCSGDSGGPLLMTRADGTVAEIGITSGGEQQCSARFPGYYTRADLVANWVNAWIGAVAASPGSGPVAPPSTIPPVSGATPPLGELSSREVPGALRQAILARMGARFRGARYHSHCTRQSPSSAKCNVSWSRRGSAYSGVVTIFLRYDRLQRLVVVGSKAKFNRPRAQR
jgi:secreted trypsin-like serine protease